MQCETMKDIINYAAEKYGDNAAFRYKVGKNVEEKSYNDLKRDTNAFSAALNRLGMIGKHAAVVGATSYEWIVAYFGVANSGGVVVPIDALLPEDSVADLLNRADIDVFIFDKAHSKIAEYAKKMCPNIKVYISMNDDENYDLSVESLIKEDNEPVDVEIDKDKMCAILFTSGTTGKSKGVMLTHRNLSDNATCLDMKIPPQTVSMTVLPIHHAYCFTMDILKGIYIGTIICINDSMMRLVKNMNLYQPELILLVPMIIESLYSKIKNVPAEQRVEIKKAVFGEKLRIIYSGGAYLNPEYIGKFEEFGIKLLQGYGMTECSPVISTTMEEDVKIEAVGKLVPNCTAKIVDNEIWVKGSSVMMGYYKMPEETKEALEDGWLKTGDLGYVDEDNFVYITGRKKNLIILSNGENVSPEEIENIASCYDLVKEVIVRGKNGIIEAEIFPDMEYIEAEGILDVQAELQKIIDEINKSFPSYKRIAKLIVRDEEFEKTPSKKIKRT